MDGDGDGVGVDDFAVDFSVSDTGFLLNPNFDAGLSPWASLDFVWNTSDDAALPTSGSAEVKVATGMDSLVHPCIELSGVTGLGSQLLARIENPTRTSPLVELVLAFYSAGSRGGQMIGVLPTAGVVGDTSGSWVSSWCWIEMPTQAVSARPIIRFLIEGELPDQVLVDRVDIIPMLFGNGFESGTTDGWSSATP